MAAGNKQRIEQEYRGKFKSMLKSTQVDPNLRNEVFTSLSMLERLGEFVNLFTGLLGKTHIDLMLGNRKS